MPFGYYDGLSSDEAAASDDDENDDDDDDDDDDASSGDDGEEEKELDAARRRPPAQKKKLVVVVHADVDCFYCQCEQIDRQLHDDNNDQQQPLGIGQKHIIVTCNYAAREYGVTKLMLQSEALQKCPHLLIFDGSDLERYRQHSRRIYEYFRTACQELFSSSLSLSLPFWNNNLSIRKGCMDEMIAAIEIIDTAAADAVAALLPAAPPPLSEKEERDIYVYGDHQQQQHESSIRSGTHQTTTAARDDEQEERTAPRRRRRRGSKDDDSVVVSMRLRRLLLHVASVVRTVRQRIQDETGFAVTMGVSTNPFLAKLASGLRKPGVVNLLFPPPTNDDDVVDHYCRRRRRATTTSTTTTRSLVAGLPLRRVTGVGRQTVRALEPYLRAQQQLLLLRQRDDHRTAAAADDDHGWTCGDVLKLPRANVISALENVQSNLSPSRACDRLLNLCRGIDHSVVVDDEGGPPKTLSVENSFRRGTTTTIGTPAQLHDELLQDLYRRLPRLFDDRTAWSTHPELAYPTTIRLTVRLVVAATVVTPHSSQRSSSSTSTSTITKSMQHPFNGQTFLQCASAPEREKLLRRAVTPILHSLLFRQREANKKTASNFDLTRVNIALTNFQDVVVLGSSSVPSPRRSQQQQQQPKSPRFVASPPGATKTKTTTTTSSHHQTQGSIVKRRRIDDFFARKR